MADWTKPTITSNYVTFVDEVKDRDYDAISLQFNPVTNPPYAAVRLLRAPIKFQQWLGGTWGELPLSVDGGGTGSATGAGARTNLGLGTMSIQNSTSIAVTGGNLTNVGLAGYIGVAGSLVITAQALSQGFAVTGVGGGHSAAIFNNGPASDNYGLFIQAGTNAIDNSLQCRTKAGVDVFVVAGNKTVRIPWALTIPVGVNMWAPV